ncbi:hypothetical protein GW17_00003115 [Ensete ventricosum]|nr:hypothetical protein GW17_00003115 [Ensete ventricosum]
MRTINQKFSFFLHQRDSQEPMNAQVLSPSMGQVHMQFPSENPTTETNQSLKTLHSPLLPRLAMFSLVRNYFVLPQMDAQKSAAMGFSLSVLLLRVVGVIVLVSATQKTLKKEEKKRLGSCHTTGFPWNARLFYSDYNFTVSIFWSPFLIKGGEAGGVDNLWNLYLDEVDDNWAARVQAVDILIISSGTWFTRPSIYFKKRQPFGCNYCAQSLNLTMVSLYSANRAAFRSAFKAIGKLRGFRGVTVLRTVSPSHFENGKWDRGGTCNRTRPARREETRLEAVELEMYRAQVKEFERARREWELSGLQLKMMDATAAMLMRPDGHPDVYGHRPEQRVQLHNDCVHWCLPGPIDLWNDLLLHMLSNLLQHDEATTYRRWPLFSVLASSWSGVDGFSSGHEQKEMVVSCRRCYQWNFTLKNGDQPEYIHPYLVKASSSSLTFCYPSRFHTPAYIYQSFTPDLTISSNSSSGRHVVSSFDDLSVTVDLPPALRFFLVRGSPFITCATLGGSAAPFSISSVNAFIDVSANAARTKHTLRLNSGQTFLCYSSSPLQLSQQGNSLLTTPDFAGVVRVAFLPDPGLEAVLDQFSACYPVSGEVCFDRPFCVEYKWEKKGWGDLLLLAHPLHLRLLSSDGCRVSVLKDFKYNSIDGELVGVVGDSWLLKTETIPITWHSTKGTNEGGYAEIIAALSKDVNGLTSAPITTTSSYFYGKAIARAARLALIAEEVGFPDVIPIVQQFLKDSITPWLDGSFSGNGFLYDPKWGGMVTKQGSTDSGADFGFGIFNDHHYHLGYFLYVIAVLAKFDPAWARKYRPQAYSMMADFMTLSRKQQAKYTRLRCFDVWKLHSWAGGLTEFADGRNQESTSEAVNAYYSAALMGLSYGDAHLVSIGSTLAAFEIQAAETWWQVKEGEGLYEDDFTRENRVVGVLWANKRDSGLWFAPADWKECRLGIQVLPLLPITEVLFHDVGFVQELVKWTLPALSREGVAEGWKGFVYAMEGVYDKGTALEKTRGLNGYDDGNSLSNLLWWLHSRGDSGEGSLGWVRNGWFVHYCH